MGMEIEAKMKVPNHDAVRARLKEVGATPDGSVLETNTFFDTPERTLLAQDKGLRVRHTIDPQSKAEQTIITFKGPRQKSAMKSRDERELHVENAIHAMSLFEGLGFARLLTFQKRRESWKLGNCRVELDEMPHLGHFVEIEGPDESTILQIRAQLGMDNDPMVKQSYSSLLARYLDEHRIAHRTVTFQN